MPGAFANIDLDALTHNASCIKSLLSSTEMCTIVKANAYGHGLLHTAPVLGNYADYYGVVRLEEAQIIRELGINKSIILMCGFYNKAELLEAIRLRAQMVLHDVSQLVILERVSLTKKFNVWVKIKSCMNRLGFDHASLEDVFNRLNLIKGCNIHGVMTHLPATNADSLDEICRQTEYFRAKFEKSAYKTSISNSACSIRHKQWVSTNTDVARIGLALYGVSPLLETTSSNIKLKPVMNLYAPVIAISTLVEGESIGYDCSYLAKNNERIAIVAAGYGDGYPRVDTGVVAYGHQLLPIRGYVSMDMMAVALPQDLDIKVGDNVQLWGDKLPIEMLARMQNRSPYEVLMPVSSRVKMNYIHNHIEVQHEK